MTQSNSDAQHPATPIHLQQARKNGDLAKSQELSAALQLLFGMVAMYLLAHGLIAHLADFSTITWSTHSSATCYSAEEFNSQMRDSVWKAALWLLPLLAIIWCGAVFSHLIQTGPAVVIKNSLFEPRALHPASGFSKLFSMRNLSRGALGIPKIVIVVGTALWSLWLQRMEIANLAYHPVEDLAPRIVNSLFFGLMAVVSVITVLAVFDFLIERFSFFQRNRMTDQQLRDENKMQGVSPQVIGRRQQIYQDLQRPPSA